MATYSFPTNVAPVQFEMRLVAEAARSESIFTGDTRTADRGGQRWAGSATFKFNRNKTTGRNTLADLSLMKALMAKLRGQANRFTMRAFDHIKVGSYTGTTPRTSGTQVIGPTLNVIDLGNTITARAGDMLSYLGQLQMITADTVTAADGSAALPVTPWIQALPPDATALEFDQPEGTFMLADDPGWSISPGKIDTLLSFSFLSDVYLGA